MKPESLPSHAQSRPVAVGRCAAWLHPASGKHGVLMVGPMGFEALCSRLSWQILGDMIAAKGMHALRFEYAGDGDSLDAPEGDQIAAAQDAIRQAVQWMRAELGMETVSIVGLRLGSLLALKALDGAPEIDRLALLAPVTSGRAFLREQKMASQIIAELRPGQDAGPGEINLCGFVTRKNDVDAITAMSIRSAPAAARMLVLLEPERPLPDILAEGRNPDAIEVHTFKGYARLMTPPTESVTPFEDFRRVADWLGGNATISAVAPALAQQEAVLLGDSFRETRFRFGPDNRLAGVLCEPLSGQTPGICVHLLNAGANCHIGWAGMSIEHARRLAQEGFASLRYDFTGVGDSAWTEEGPRPLIYSPLHVADSLVAVEAMSARGFGQHVLAGLCAGGYTAFHAAAQDSRISGSIAANAIRLIWHPHDNLDSLTQEMIQPSAVYKRKALSTTEWKRLLQGEISLGKVAKVGASYATKFLRKAGAVVGLSPPVSADSRAVRMVLQEVSKRGGLQVFIHAERDQSRDESERHFGAGAAFAARMPGVTLIDIPGADHELTPKASRDRFYDAILALAKNQRPAAG